MSGGKGQRKENWLQFKEKGGGGRNRLPENTVCVCGGGHLGKKEEWHIFWEEGQKDEMGEMLQKM